MTWISVIGWIAIGIFIWGIVLLRKRLALQKQKESLRTQLFLYELEKSREGDSGSV